MFIPYIWEWGHSHFVELWISIRRWVWYALSKASMYSTYCQETVRKCFPNLQCIMPQTKFYLISFWRKIIVYKWLITEKGLIVHSFWVLINQNSWKWDFKNYSSKLFVGTSNHAVILVNKKIYFIHSVYNVHNILIYLW